MMRKIFGKTDFRQLFFRLASYFPVLLAVIGYIMVSVGIGMIYAPVGWIVGGLSLLLLEQRAANSLEGRA